MRSGPSADDVHGDDRLSEVFERVTAVVSTWPEQRRWSHGFGLVVGTDDVAVKARRRHARTVLVGEQILTDLAQHNNGDRVVIFKGREVAALYPRVVMRHFRDLDLLVREPEDSWQWLVDRGFRQNPNRSRDIDHHHLPAVLDPLGQIAVEVHHQVNAPVWARFDSDLVTEECAPSRTGIDGIMRPRDDLHAIVMALHCWKGGFTRLRDLFDSLLLAAVADRDVAETADSMGLGRMWALSVRIAHHHLYGEPDRGAELVTRTLLPRRAGISDRTRTRVLLPFLVANPVRVTQSHLAERRLGAAARRR